MYYMQLNGPASIIGLHEKSTKFSGMLGEDEKMIREKIC